MRRIEEALILLVVAASALSMLLLSLPRQRRQGSPPVDSCVLITNGDGGWGSGAVVGPDTILTAGHVADHNDLSVETEDDQTYDVVFVVRCGTDAALLIVDANLPPPIKVSQDQTSLGDEVTAIGTPFSPLMRSTFSRGYVANVGQEGFFSDGSIQPLLYVSMSCGSGSSGSPVMRNGKIIGVLIATWCTYTIVVPTVDFQELLEWLRP